MKVIKTITNVGKIINKLPLLLVVGFLLTTAISYSLSANDTKILEPRLISSTCGGIQTSINFDCKGSGNPITLLIFAIIRFLSLGVGLLIIGSVIVGGIQYIGARGDPGNVQKAVNRLIGSVIALVVFIFAYAILNYLIPGGFFK